jgi:hypothetical protein
MVTARRDRRGTSQAGCLGTLLLFGLFVYALAQVGPPWLRYQQFRDEMHADAQFAISLPDSVIRSRLMLRADTLRLPLEAKRKLYIHRSQNPKVILIRSQYSERIHFLLLGDKVLTFRPKVEEPI